MFFKILCESRLHNIFPFVKMKDTSFIAKQGYKYKYDPERTISNEIMWRALIVIVFGDNYVGVMVVLHGTTLRH